MPKVLVYTAETLLDLISKNKFIIDRKDKKFKNKRLKEDTWSEIGRTFGITGYDAMKKFKSMKDYYFRIKRNAQLITQRNGGEAEEANWMYFSRIDKLLGGSPDMNENTCTNEVEHKEPFEVEIIESSDQGTDNATNEEFDIDIKSMESGPESPEPARKIRKDEAGNQIEIQSVNTVSDFVYDEISAFAKYLETGLRNLPIKRARMLIKKINNDLSDELIRKATDC